MLKLAAILILLLGIAHSWLGERYILIRLFRRNDLPKLFGGTDFTVRTLRFAWHITTIAWLGFAATLWRASSGSLDRSFVLAAVGCTAIVSGLLPLIHTRGRHLSWIVFFVVGGICLWASAT